jgi:hypothetical protein
MLFGDEASRYSGVYTSVAMVFSDYVCGGPLKIRRIWLDAILTVVDLRDAVAALG